MYLGQREIQFNIYTDKTIRSGIRYGMRHIYQCDHCGHEHAILEQAIEPFYCSECVNRLVEIEPPFQLTRESNRKPAPEKFHNSDKRKQKVLITGLDCLPGQMDLFQGGGNG